MKTLITIALLGLFASPIIAQYSDRFINSYDIELQQATFDESLGLMVKANHWWYTGTNTTPHHPKETRIQSSIALQFLTAPGTSPFTSGTLNEFTGRLNVRVHLGVERAFFADARGYVFLSGYVGISSVYIRGTLDQNNQGFRRAYTNFDVYGDFGTRFGIGFDLTEQLGLQITMTNSLIHVDNPLGVLPGLLFWGPDALALGGIGIQYRL